MEKYTYALSREISGECPCSQDTKGETGFSGEIGLGIDQDGNGKYYQILYTADGPSNFKSPLMTGTVIVRIDRILGAKYGEIQWKVTDKL